MEFHLGDILCVTTGRLVSLDGMDGVYDILNFMTNDSLSTVQLGRAATEATPYLYEQLPWLSEITPDLLDEVKDKESLHRVLALLTNKYGEFHELIPMHPEDHEVFSVEEDLFRLGFEGKIIPLDEVDDDVH